MDKFIFAHSLIPFSATFSLPIAEIFKRMIRMIRMLTSSTSQQRLALPPGPKPWPLVGCNPEMLQNKPTSQWIHKLMKELNSHIICIRLGKVHVIVVSSPEIARDFLKTNDVSFMSRPDFMSAQLSSCGYLSSALSPSGQQWKKMRTLMLNYLLSPACHSWLHKKRVREADNLVTYIYNQCQIDNGGPGKEEVEHVDALFTDIKYNHAFCISNYLPLLRWNVDLDGHEMIIREAVHSVRKYQDPEIETRIQQWDSGTRKQKEDLLDVLIGLRDENNNPFLSIDEIKAQILEMLMAVVDNPSNACEWALAEGVVFLLAEMINKPELLQRATEELDHVVGRNRHVQESDIENLNYIKACAREAFRLHPVAPFNLPHVSTQDTVVAGYFIPKGSQVLLSRLALGRNKDVWEDPLTFDPSVT